jgi:hypothetical protein
VTPTLLLGLLGAALAGPAEDLLGPLPADTVVLGVDQHAEYLRVRLQIPETVFTIEVTEAGGGEPVCEADGRALWVRRDLSEGESFEWEPLPTVVDQACERLGSVELSGPIVVVQREALEPAPEGPFRLRPLHLVVLIWLIVAHLGLPRDRYAVGAGLMAFGVRVALSARTVLLGGDAAFERLLSARGRLDPDLYYGEAWACLMGPYSFALGDPPGLVLGLNVLVSAMTVWVLVGLLERLGATEVERFGAGILLALSPLAVALAGTEIHFVAVGLLQVAAVYGALSERGGWRGQMDGLLAASSLGLLIHLRPLQIAFVLLPLGLLAWRRRWLHLALGLALVGWRAAQVLPHAGGGSGVMQYERYLELPFLARLMMPGPEAVDLALRPTVTPMIVPLLAMIGLVVWLRQERWKPVAVLAIAGTLALLPYAVKTQPFADPLRFQLPVQTWWVALAGLGLGVLWRRGLLGQAALVLGLVASLYVARAPVERWAWQDELGFWRQLELEEGERVWINDSQDPNGHTRRWLTLNTPGTWLGHTQGQPADGDLVVRGTADRHPGASFPYEDCELERVALELGSSVTDGWVELGSEPVELAAYRIHGCPDG